MKPITVMKSKAPVSAGKLTMKQIFIAEWGNTYSVVGLGSDGCVYRYQASLDGWIPYTMKKVVGSNYNS